MSKSNDVIETPKRKLINDYLAITIAIITFLGFVVQTFGIPNRVKDLERKVTVLEKENQDLKLIITQVNTKLGEMQPKINSLYNHFLQKGLDK